MKAMPDEAQAEAIHPNLQSNGISIAQFSPTFHGTATPFCARGLTACAGGIGRAIHAPWTGGAPRPLFRRWRAYIWRTMPAGVQSMQAD